MQAISRQSRSLGAILIAACLTVGLVLAMRAGSAGQPQGGVDLAPFKAMARARDCVDIRNRLFLIDDQLVFWEGAGHCADASYGATLYGRTLDEVLCSVNDSEAGPMKNCHDEGYRAMFETMTRNLNRPDLGLGATHSVQPVPF